jgi:hypothetical protein
MDTSSAVAGSAPSVASPAPATGCPVDHRVLRAVVPGCPIDHTAGAGGGARQRSRADQVVRSLLRIKERPAHLSEAQAYSTFQKSMLISATRCTLTYVIFPFVLPAIGLAARVGPLLGVIIGSIAITCDVFTVRRFFAVDHKWRWHFSAIALGVIGLLSVLLVQDIAHLVG